MPKIKLKWLEFGTPLFMITYLNFAIFIMYFLDTKILISLNKLLNVITGNLINKLFGNIELDMIHGLYAFYTYLIIVTTVMFCILLFMLVFTNFKVIHRVEEIFGWLFMLIIHQFNILLIIFMMSNSTNLFSIFNMFNITGFIAFTFIFFVSIDVKEEKYDR